MATLKMTRQERAQWQRLYALADRVDRLSPWEWMGAADSFGLAFHGKQEPGFVMFGGQPKGFRHVRFLMGWKAFYELVTRLAEPAKQTPTWLLEIPMLELLFVEERLLFDHERVFLSALGREVADGQATPVFRSIVPGYHPWLPDAAERAELEAALYQAYGMAMRVESDGMLLKARFPHEILLRAQDGQGVWRDTWSPVKEMADEEIEVKIVAKPLQALAAGPLWPMSVQLDLVFTPLTIGPAGRRPQTAYVLLAVDAVSGMILAEDLFQATEGIAAMWAKVPERLVEIFGRLGGCPESIEVATDRMANLLRPLGEILPFKLVRRERLAMLEKARVKLSEYMKNLDAKN
ncbi:MAG: hypothetical protein LBW77_05320 [Verrucomicrobiota bacterium]|jgi:hypothetical protein|nr:hypothetical protein [Verrucomicrobiota bacterium]